MTTAFQPKAEVAEWKLIYENGLLPMLEIENGFNQVIGYDALDEILGRTFVDNRTPLYRAMAELEKQHHRTLEAVKNLGYRVVLAREHIRIGRNHVRRGTRQFKRSRERWGAAPREFLTTQEQKTLEQHSLEIARLSTDMNRVKRRLQMEENTDHG